MGLLSIGTKLERLLRSELAGRFRKLIIADFKDLSIVKPRHAASGQSFSMGNILVTCDITVSFLTRSSVAVAHEVAQCTNRCTRRKVIVGYG